MSTDTTNVQAAAPNALQDFTNCPEWGRGGQFIYDPATQTRTRIDATLAAAEPAVATATAEASAPAVTDAAPAPVKKGAARA